MYEVLRWVNIRLPILKVEGKDSFLSARRQQWLKLFICLIGLYSIYNRMGSSFIYWKFYLSISEPSCNQGFWEGFQIFPKSSSVF